MAKIDRVRVRFGCVVKRVPSNFGCRMLRLMCWLVIVNSVWQFKYKLIFFMIANQNGNKTKKFRVNLLDLGGERFARLLFDISLLLLLMVLLMMVMLMMMMMLTENISTRSTHIRTEYV